MSLFSNNLVAGNRKLVSLAGKYSFQIPCGAVVQSVIPEPSSSITGCLFDMQVL